MIQKIIEIYKIYIYMVYILIIKFELKFLYKIMSRIF